MPDIDSLITYTVPEGWEVESEPGRLTVSEGYNFIDVRLETGTPAGYLRTLRPPIAESEGLVVAGRPVAVYTTKTPLSARDPHVKGPVKKWAPEYTVLLPLGRGRLLVFRNKEPSSEKPAAGWKAFTSFLKSVKLKKSKRR